jgi:hypothetical protein
MKALSLWQPWAALLVHARKRVETRSWSLSHRGPLLIHAAKKWNGDLSSMCVREPFKASLECMGIFHDNPFTKPHGLHFGAIIGRVNVVACVPTSEVGLMDFDDVEPCHWPDNPKYLALQISRNEQAFGDYSPGRFAFLCSNPIVFANPIPYSGEQGLFNVPETLLPKEAA